MHPLSSSELIGQDVGFFNPDIESLKQRATHFMPMTTDEILEKICRGSMPKLCADPDESREEYYENYIELYLKRDIRENASRDDMSLFNDFLADLALRTGQIFSPDIMSRELRTKQDTINRWTSTLENLGVIYKIRPYYDNPHTSMIKNPKYYFTDTGLASYLCNLHSAADILQNEMKGHLFETYVVTEILKNYYNHHNYYSYRNSTNTPELYYYRDTDKKEIDLLIATEDKKLYPIEIKFRMTPSGTAGRNLSAGNADGGADSIKQLDAGKEVKEYPSLLSACKMDVQPAIIICLTDSVKRYSETAWLYPAAAI